MVYCLGRMACWERVVCYLGRVACWEKWYVIENFDVAIKHSVEKFIVAIEKGVVAVKKGVFAIKKVVVAVEKVVDLVEKFAVIAVIEKGVIKKVIGKELVWARSCSWTCSFNCYFFLSRSIRIGFSTFS